MAEATSRSITIAAVPAITIRASRSSPGSKLATAQAGTAAKKMITNGSLPGVLTPAMARAAPTAPAASTAPISQRRTPGPDLMYPPEYTGDVPVSPAATTPVT